MTIHSKLKVTKFPDGTVYVSGEPKFVGKMPTTFDKDDPEAKEMFEALDTIIRAGNVGN